MSLFWRIFTLNALVLVTAAALLMGPWVTVSTPVSLGEALVIGCGVLTMLVVNAVLFHYGLAPLKRLSRAMASADLVHPSARPEVSGHTEIAELLSTFNAMLDRLEHERALSSARVVAAQEGERQHLARELHDEVGQTLTAVLLQLNWLADEAAKELREELLAVKELTRDSLDEIRCIARRLRPGVLEDLGLPRALRALVAEFSTPGLLVHHQIASELPRLAGETELAVYRVAQEGLSNALRHSHAQQVSLHLYRRSAHQVELVVRDNGCGLQGKQEGSGIRGMLERALLVGADLTFRAPPDGGTEVRFLVPSVSEGTR
ncbi:sensor histidine kinase [Streptomyces sp. NPDC046716]|uniref:HAMP domain-containing sensor histidine kinase n=1 Tax=Streptomyces sp. NPDC046716 TaxID=3157093 RepID=UPI0033CA969A